VVLAQALRAHGEIDAARAHLEAALPAVRAAYGAESLEAASAERELAMTLHRNEDYGRAITLLTHAWNVQRGSLGEAHEDTAATLGSLGIALEQAQRYAEAETAYRRALAALERRLGGNHPRVAASLADLAALLDRMSRAAEARPLFVRAIAIQRATLGEGHERLAETLFSYGILELGAAGYDAAERSFLQALAIFGPDRFEAAHCQRYLGLVAAGRERYAEAAALFTQAADTYRRTVGEDDLQRHRALANAGWMEVRQGRGAEGRRQLAAAVAAIERLAGGESYELRLPLKQLGEAQTEAGEGAAAVATLGRVRALEEKLFGTIEHREVGGSDLLLARALLARGRGDDREEARRRLDEALAIFSRVAADDLLHGQTLLASGKLALETGDRERARRELAAAMRLLTAKRGAEHVQTREAVRLLARTGDG
jgi:tetratricopeptide (TPR) repeat protein